MRAQRAKRAQHGQSRVKPLPCRAALGLRPETKSMLPPLRSFGVLLYEMLTGEPPHRGMLQPLEAPADCPQEVADMQLRWGPAAGRL